MDSIRPMENYPEPSLFSGRQPQPYLTTVEPGPPLSPRQVPQDDSRRSSIADLPRAGVFRPPIPEHLSATTPHRYGSLGTAHSSPGYTRSPIPPSIAPQQQQQQQFQQQPLLHPLSNVSSPPGSSVGRRHTSADIRQHGWSPFGGGGGTGSGAPPHWPPSPHQTPTTTGDQHVQDVLSRYEMGAPRRFQSTSRQVTPPLNSDGGPPSMLTADGGGWNTLPRTSRREVSLPPTRRSSMASNVHSLLNPTDKTDDAPLSNEDRKRRRLD